MSLRIEQERVWTYEDYRGLPDDGNRYEVIDGRLYVTPAPSSVHQLLVVAMLDVLAPLRAAGGLVIPAPLDVVFAGATPVQPDLVYVSPGNRSIVNRRRVDGVPDLAVEILSPSTASRDQVVKLNKYAAAGVPHYWILDSRTPVLMLFLLEGESYRLSASLGPGDRHEPAAFPGVILDVDALCADLPE